MIVEGKEFAIEFDKIKFHQGVCKQPYGYGTYSGSIIAEVPLVALDCSKEKRIVQIADFEWIKIHEKAP
jgi:hypothetical protein